VMNNVAASGENMKTMLVVCMALMLVACATTWTKPGATADMLKADNLECEFEAQKATADNPDAGQASFSRLMVERTCMEAKGWERAR
jgi:hypothetical protein